MLHLEFFKITFTMFQDPEKRCAGIAVCMYVLYVHVDYYY